MYARQLASTESRVTRQCAAAAERVIEEGGASSSNAASLAQLLHNSPRMQERMQRTTTQFGPAAMQRFENHGVVHGSPSLAPVTQAQPEGSAQNKTVQMATLCKINALHVLPHWEVVAEGTVSGDSARWQIGLANPRATTGTSASLSTKPGSSSGCGGSGEVRWTRLKGDSLMKTGYTRVQESVHDDDADRLLADQDLLDRLPPDGTRKTYRLTSKNCQHFLVDAWRAAGLAPDIEHHLTLGEEAGHDLNHALVGSIGGLGLGAWGMGYGAQEVMNTDNIPAMLGMAGLGALATVGAGSVLREGGGARRHAPAGVLGAGGLIFGAGAILGGASLATLPVLCAAGVMGLAGMGLSRLYKGSEPGASQTPRPQQHDREV